MNTSTIPRATGLKQLQLLGEKLNRSLRKEVRKVLPRQEVLNARIKRSYPRPGKS
ncbi:MAG: hypothetical protein ACO4CH_02845 [Saprospiraceae bacterium]|jgi:hypothetical protein